MACATARAATSADASSAACTQASGSPAATASPGARTPSRPTRGSTTSAGRRPPAELFTSLDQTPIPEAPDWSEEPHLRAEQGELREVLERAIRALPMRYRTALILRDVEGLSTREAAAVMQLGEAAFKSRLHRARLAVRRSLDQYYLEEQR